MLKIVRFQFLFELFDVNSARIKKKKDASNVRPSLNKKLMIVNQGNKRKRWLREKVVARQLVTSETAHCEILMKFLEGYLHE